MMIGVLDTTVGLCSSLLFLFRKNGRYITNEECKNNFNVKNISGGKKCKKNI